MNRQSSDFFRSSEREFYAIAMMDVEIDVEYFVDLFARWRGGRKGSGGGVASKFVDSQHDVADVAESRRRASLSVMPVISAAESACILLKNNPIACCRGATYLPPVQAIAISH